MASEAFIGGSHNENPKLNSIICDVDFFDGQVKEYADNVISENILTRIDS